jgi:hypothetical protein
VTCFSKNSYKAQERHYGTAPGAWQASAQRGASRRPFGKRTLYPLSKRLTCVVISFAAAAAVFAPSSTASDSVPTARSISG